MAGSMVLGLSSPSWSVETDTAEQVAGPCVDAARAAASQAGLDGSEGLSFGCLNSAVTVEAEATGQTTVAETTSINPNDCLVTDDPYQWITSDLEGGVDSCWFWGQIDHPVNGDWLGRAFSRGVLYPGDTVMDTRLYLWPDTSRPGAWQTSFTANVVLKRERRGLPPAPVNVQQADIGPGGGTSDYLLLLRTDASVTGGTYSVHYEDITVIDTYHDFDIVLTGPQVATKRFYCPPIDAVDTQCRWPDGQEAPL